MKFQGHRLRPTQLVSIRPALEPSPHPCFALQPHLTPHIRPILPSSSRWLSNWHPHRRPILRSHCTKVDKKTRWSTSAAGPTTQWLCVLVSGDSSSISHLWLGNPRTCRRAHTADCDSFLLCCGYSCSFCWAKYVLCWYVLTEMISLELLLIKHQRSSHLSDTPPSRANTSYNTLSRLSQVLPAFLSSMR